MWLLVLVQPKRFVWHGLKMPEAGEAGWATAGTGGDGRETVGLGGDGREWVVYGMPGLEGFEY